MILFLYVMNIYLLGGVLTKEREHLVLSKKGDWLIKTDGNYGEKEGMTKKGRSVDKNKKIAEHKLLEQMLEQMDTEDVALFKKLPEDKKKEVLEKLSEVLAKNDKAFNDYDFPSIITLLTTMLPIILGGLGGLVGGLVG